MYVDVVVAVAEREHIPGRIADQAADDAIDDRPGRRGALVVFVDLVVAVVEREDVAGGIADQAEDV